MALRRIEFIYDVLSPYSYVGFELLKRYIQPWKLDVQYKPVLIGGLFKAAGNRPPGLVPLKEKYMYVDLNRHRTFDGVDINLPEDVNYVLFKKGSLRAQRLLTACDMEAKELVFPVTESLYHRIWRDNKDITEEASLRDALQVAKVDDATAERLIQRTLDDDVKERLKQASEEVAARGVFGLPTFFVGDEMIFGADRFHHIAQLLGETYYGSAGGRYQQDVQEILDRRAKL
eukprot:m.233599 g.233599  ORF g.233599 m.233599 type:complete len:231 (-) comp17083_c0_seq15:2123-2815(-)